MRREYLPNAVSGEVLEQNERSLQHQLVSLRFLSADLQPTVTGILTAAKDPRHFLPGAYIQFVRFSGVEATTFVKDQKEISGRLVEILSQIDEVLKAQISVSSNLGDTIEVPHPDYPITALQQMVRNAVMHRNYEGTNAPIRVTWFDDRVEIESPGGPYGTVTSDNFGKGATDYRNPHIAEVMKNLGYAQRFGVGFGIAKRDLAANGNPPLETEITASQVLIRIHKRS